ncbi:MAG: hypothetical protein RLZZ491_559 [Pseudomonadota bacterium]
MTKLHRLLGRLPYRLLIGICLTWGLAPFFPEPHIWEKIKMLAAGGLVKPLDIFDLGLHGLPWLALIAKAILARRTV